MVLPAQTLLGANVKLAIGCAGETINIIAPGELVITPAANKSDKKDCWVNRKSWGAKKNS